MKKLKFFLNVSLCLCLNLAPTSAILATNSVAEYVISNEITKSTEDEISQPTQSCEDELKASFEPILADMIKNRNHCIQTLDDESLKASYNMDIKVSRWAYESEAQKIKYFKNW